MKAVELFNSHPLLDDRSRLAIMGSLAVARHGLDFTSLAKSLQLTNGNLSAHLKKLEDAELIEVTKEFVDRRPKTTYVITKLGRKEFKAHLEKIQAMLSEISHTT